MFPRILKVISSSLAAFVLTTSAAGAQTSYQLTDWQGNLTSTAAGLYEVQNYCYNPTNGVTVCTWLVRRLYGSNHPVIVIAEYPAATQPACDNGVVQQIDSGYTRSGCQVYASAAVFGVN